MPKSTRTGHDRRFKAEAAPRSFAPDEALAGLSTELRINHLVALAANVNLIAPGAGAGGLNSREIRSLGLLHRLGPKTVRQLARVSDQDPANVSRSMATLLEIGLIVKSQHPSHRQSQVISLTTAGETLYGRLRLDIERRASALLAGFTDEHRDCFVRLLERYLHNAKRPWPDGGATPAKAGDT